MLGELRRLITRLDHDRIMPGNRIYTDCMITCRVCAIEKELNRLEKELRGQTSKEHI